MSDENHVLVALMVMLVIALYNFAVSGAEYIAMP